MDDTTRKVIVNKEIETYRKLAVAFESLKVVVKRFDGKCINKKFGEALDDFLKYGKEERKYYVRAGINNTSYGNFFDISIHCYDNTVNGKKDDTGCCSSYAIYNSDCILRMEADETTTKTESGKYRIDSDAIIGKFDEKIRCLNDKAEELEKGLNVVEEMRADIDHIKHLMDIFNGKYNSRVKAVFNCDYSLKGNSGIQYR